MQVGNMKVFPKANKTRVPCSVCENIISPHCAYVHHYKIFDVHVAGKPRRPDGIRQTYTRQLHFCSEECIMLKSLEGVYRDD